MDSNAIRARLKGLGWQLIELPIRRNHPDSNERRVTNWKVIASKGERSYEVGGKTIDEALIKIGSSLGVIAQEEQK